MKFVQLCLLLIALFLIGFLIVAVRDVVSLFMKPDLVPEIGDIVIDREHKMYRVISDTAILSHHITALEIDSDTKSVKSDSVPVSLDIYDVYRLKL